MGKVCQDYYLKNVKILCFLFCFSYGQGLLGSSAQTVAPFIAKEQTSYKNALLGAGLEKNWGASVSHPSIRPVSNQLHASIQLDAFAGKSVFAQGLLLFSPQHLFQFHIHYHDNGEVMEVNENNLLTGKTHNPGHASSGLAWGYQSDVVNLGIAFTAFTQRLTQNGVASFGSTFSPEVSWEKPWGKVLMGIQNIGLFYRDFDYNRVSTKHLPTRAQLLLSKPILSKRFQWQSAYYLGLWTPFQSAQGFSYQLSRILKVHGALHLDYSVWQRWAQNQNTNPDHHTMGAIGSSVKTPKFLGQYSVRILNEWVGLEHNVSLQFYW